MSKLIDEERQRRALSDLNKALDSEKLNHGLANIREEQLRDRLKSCEAALEERDTKIARLQTLAGATEVVEGLGMCVVPRDKLRQKIIQPLRYGGGFHCMVCDKWQWSREHSPNHENNCWYGRSMLSAKGGEKG